MLFPLLASLAARTADAVLRPLVASRLGSAFDRLDADFGEVLAMALLAAVVLAPLALEDRDLPAAAVPEDRPAHARTRHPRTAQARLAPPPRPAHLVANDGASPRPP